MPLSSGFAARDRLTRLCAMTPQTFITTSWDDGHPLDLRIAEMLSRHGLTGTFYIPRSIPTGVMSASQIRELAGSFEIGAHTLNHVFLTATDNSTAAAENTGSQAWLVQVAGNSCAMFCPPAGRFNHHHEKMFAAAGFTGIRTVEFMSLDQPRLRHGLMEMPTTLQAFPHPRRNYMKNLLKRLAARSLFRYLIHGRSGEWVLLARRLLDRAIATGGVFHLWGHSWEVEETQQWVQLEQVLSMLGQAVREAPCLTNGQICQRQQRAVRAVP